MFNNQFLIQTLHPFIIYAIFGTLIGYMLVKCVILFLGIREPKVKITLLLLPVLVPFVTLAIRQFTARVCFTQLAEINKYLYATYKFICDSGNFLSYIVSPLLMLAILLALFKGLGSFVACRRVVSKYGYVVKEDKLQLISTLEKLAKKAGIATPNLVITDQRLVRSFTFGVKKPTIVMTRGILQYLDQDEIETVLAHEVAHITRGDALLNWVTVFFRDLLFFAPVVWLLFRDIVEEKEKASDDIALELTDKHLAFGEALIKVWRLSPKSLIGSLAFDNFSSQSNFIKRNGILEARLERIISPDPAKRFNLSSLSFLAVTILITSLGLLYFLC